MSIPPDKELSTIAHKVYTDDEAAHALATLKANRGNAKKTARNLNVPRTTLRQWAGRAQSDTAKPKQVPPEAYVAAQKDLGKKWEQIANRGTDITLEALEGVEPASLSMRDVKDLSLLSAIATDKHQLLAGGPTSRESREIRITFSADPSVSSLQGLGERAVSGTKALPETIEGAFSVEEPDKT